jgi:hypothetical protein
MPTFEITSPAGEKYQIDAPEGASEQDALAHLQQHLAAPAPAPAMSAGDTAKDVAASGGIGLVKGGIGLAGLPGDAASLGAKGMRAIQSGVERLFPSTAGPAPSDTPGTLTGVTLPGSADIRKGVESVTGPLYEPKTAIGHGFQTLGEFAPAALGGPGSLATRFATRAVIPAAGAEAGSAAAKGTAAEPYANVAGAIAGSVLGHKLVTPAALEDMRPTTEQVLQAGSQGYKAPAIADVSFKPNVVESLSNTITSTLDRAKLNDRLAPQTRSIVDELKTPINGSAHTIEDLETARQLLGKVAGNFTNPVEQGAASKAIELVDKYMARMPQSHLASGDAATANAALTTARANYAAGKTAERVGEKLNNAELQAGSAHSGGNIDNATRQKLRPLLTSDKQGRGLTEQELGLVENSVRGSQVGNALRTTGKLLGGGGGLGAFVTGAAGHSVAGPAGMLLPAIGYGIKKAGDAVTRRGADKIIQAIIDRSPEAQSWAATQARINAANPRQGAMAPASLSALLAAQGAQPLRLTVNRDTPSLSSVLSAQPSQ